MTETTISDYTGFELAIGSVFAVRWFTVDRWGRLRGRTFDHIWTPGENVARCRADEKDKWTVNFGQYVMGTLSTSPLSATYTMRAEMPEKKPLSEAAVEARITHSVPHLACSCGFYAFAEGCDDGGYASRGDSNVVLGVIECYGRTVLGTKGLRAEKARIVGLRTKDEQVKALYPDAEIFEQKADLLSAFDLVQRYIRTPDSDPDFWTRP